MKILMILMGLMGAICMGLGSVSLMLDDRMLEAAVALIGGFILTGLVAEI